MPTRGADPDEEEIVAGALGSSRRMRRLVADLLLLARADAGRAGPRRPCDLGEVATTAVDEVRPTAGDHALAPRRRRPVVEVDGNPDDLHRLVLNLVENGVRHTPAREHGHGRGPPPTAARRVLEVSDDGPGLPEGVGDQIFARFVRGNGPADVSRDSGTGLGLAIVKAVAVSHGGRVEAGRSAAGGASFVVHLPLGEPRRRRADRPQRFFKDPLQGRHRLSPRTRHHPAKSPPTVLRRVSNWLSLSLCQLGPPGSPLPESRRAIFLPYRAGWLGRSTFIVGLVSLD